MTLIATGGFGRFLISFKWSFFNFLTYARVVSNVALAYATPASAYAASYDASAFWISAYFFSTDTTICTYSACALSTVSFAINFSVSSEASSSYGCFFVNITCISYTATFASCNLSNPFCNLEIENFDSSNFYLRIIRYIDKS